MGQVPNKGHCVGCLGISHLECLYCRTSHNLPLEFCQTCFHHNKHGDVFRCCVCFELRCTSSLDPKFDPLGTTKRRCLKCQIEPLHTSYCEALIGEK